MDLGSCREVIEDGRTGILVDSVEGAVQGLARIGAIDRRVCRRRVETRFSVDAMVAAYERVYGMIFECEERR